MSREDAHFKLRLPEDLRASLKSSAALNRRSLTAEIIQRLYQSIEDERLALAAGMAIGQQAGIDAVEGPTTPIAHEEKDLREKLNSLSIEEMRDAVRTLDLLRGLLAKK